MQTNKYQRCPKCQQFGWIGSHQCFPFEVQVLSLVANGYEKDLDPPDWTIRQDPEEFEPEIQYAETHEKAAERYAINWDSYDCEYSIASQEDAMRIRVSFAGKTKVFALTGWFEANYQAEVIPHAV